MNTPVERYIDHINEKILPHIDYEKLQASYGTDVVYAKEILQLLHAAMVDIYGSARPAAHHGDEGFVVIPGVVRGRESGEMCVVLLDLDLSSSGEHWGTSFLCEHGVVEQGDFDSPISRAVCERFVPYDYGCTADIPGDIHVDQAKLPAQLKTVLQDFHDGRKPTIIITPMSDWCMSKDYNGAERFHDGSRPLMAETKFADIIVSGIVGEKNKVSLSVSPYEEHTHFFNCELPSKETAIKLAATLGNFINTQDKKQFGDGRFLAQFEKLLAPYKEKSLLRHSLEDAAAKSKALAAELSAAPKQKSDPAL